MMKLMKKWIGFVLAAAGAFLLMAGAYQLMNSRTYQLFGDLIYRVETEQRAVALTFDDGPTERTEQILELLDQYDAKATFFLIGKDIEAHPEEAKKIAAKGHQIGNHTYSHQRMVFKSYSFVKEEIEKTDRLIREAGYTGEIDVRPPYSKKLIIFPYYLHQHQRETIMMDLEPETFYSRSEDQVEYVKKHVRPGSIFLLHPMYDQSGEALKTVEGILQALTEEGYAFVTVNELQDMER